MRLRFLVPALAALALAGCAGTTSIGFEDGELVHVGDLSGPFTLQIDVNVGDVFEVGDALEHEASGTRIYVLPFRYNRNSPNPVDDWDVQGYVRIVQENLAGGYGNALHFNNACLGIGASNGGIKGVKLKFGEHGGNTNLIVNGTLLYDEDFASMPAVLTGGVSLSVSPSLPQGTLELLGNMEDFYFTFPFPPGLPARKYSGVVGGGQELWIDDLELRK